MSPTTATHVVHRQRAWSIAGADPGYCLPPAGRDSPAAWAARDSPAAWAGRDSPAAWAGRAGTLYWISHRLVGQLNQNLGQLFGRTEHRPVPRVDVDVAQRHPDQFRYLARFEPGLGVLG